MRILIVFLTSINVLQSEKPCAKILQLKYNSFIWLVNEPTFTILYIYSAIHHEGGILVYQDTVASSMSGRSTSHVDFVLYNKPRD
jgi:hypothetical protein